MAGMTPLTPDTPLVVFGDDWGRHVSTLQHLFRRVVDRHPVIWVNSYGHRIPQLTLYDLRRAVQKVAAMVRPRPRPTGAAGPFPVAIIEPRALPWHHRRIIHAFNTASLRRDILRTLARVAPGRRPVFITGTPVAEGLVGRLGELASFYFIIDDYAELPYVTPELVTPHETQILRKVDAVVATAAALVERKRPASGRAHHVPQGVNYEHFAEPRPVPAELAALPRPILGFAGGVSECLDVEQVRTLAQNYPSASVVLVGPISIDLAPLTLPNVHILGPRPYADLPAYVQAFDVGLIPYVLNDWTRSVDPLKLLEYLAAGLPVVTTPLPEAGKYGNVVHIATAGAAFLTGVQQALTQRDATSRTTFRSVARANTWEARAQAVLDMIAEVVASREAYDASAAPRTGSRAMAR